MFRLLILLSVTFAVARCLCVTNNQGPQKNESCVFPFKFRGITYTECTSVADPDKKLWCSTETDEEGKHVGAQDQWGYCTPGCPGVPPESEDFNATSSTTQIPTTTPTSTLTSIISSTTIPTTTSTISPTNQSDLGTFLPESGCGFSTATGYIVGGVETKRGDYPFAALLGFDTLRFGRIYGCGGTLINRRYVLTAAHCQNSLQPIVEVVLGEHNLDENPDCKGCAGIQSFDITFDDVTVHEDYSLSKTTSEANDIALIRLPRLVDTAFEDSNSIVLPVCLPKPGANVPKDDVLVIGWGRTNNENGDFGNITRSGAFSSVQQELSVPIVPIETCKESKPFKKLNMDRHICAGGEEGKDSCKGDSGGPLIARRNKDSPMYLIGIVSFGLKICGAGLPGVYTNVQYYMGWIKSHLEP